MRQVTGRISEDTHAKKVDRRVVSIIDQKLYTE